MERLTMPLTFKQRLAVCNTHFNKGVPISSIADLLDVSVEEVQEVCDIAEDYLGGEKLPRRRPQRTEAPAAAPEPKTRARTAPAAEVTPMRESIKTEDRRPLPAADAETRTSSIGFLQTHSEA